MTTTTLPPDNKYKSEDEYLHDVLLNRGMIIVKKYDCTFLPPASWPVDEHEQVFWQEFLKSRLTTDSPMRSELLSKTLPIDEVARLLKVSNNKIAQLVRDGAFGAIKIERLWRIYRASIVRLLETAEA